MEASAVSVAFEVDRFERVDASSGTALLRLAGHFDVEVDGGPVLVVDDGRRSQEISPLPDPSRVAGRAWRGAFAVPTELLESGRVAYALRVGGSFIDLPRPAGRTPLARPRRPTAPPASSVARRRAAVDVEWLARQGRETAELRAESQRLAAERAAAVE